MACRWHRADRPIDQEWIIEFGAPVHFRRAAGAPQIITARDGRYPASHAHVFINNNEGNVNLTPITLDAAAVR